MVRRRADCREREEGTSGQARVRLWLSSLKVWGLSIMARYDLCSTHKRTELLSLPARLESFEEKKTTAQASETFGQFGDD